VFLCALIGNVAIGKNVVISNVCTSLLVLLLEVGPVSVVIVGGVVVCLVSIGPVVLVHILVGKVFVGSVIMYHSYSCWPCLWLAICCFS